MSSACSRGFSPLSESRCGRHWREFIFVGLLGGLATFSTFGLDTFALSRAGSAGPAVVNVILQVIGGLAAVWLGYRLGAHV